MSEFETGVQVNVEGSEVKQVGDRVSSRLRARREQAHAQGLDYDHLTESGPLVFGEHSGTTDLQTRVRELDAMAEETWVSLAMQDRQLPFFLRFFAGVERLFHKLAVKYVNRMAGRQLVVNKSVAGTMAILVEQLERIEANQADLQNRLSALEERLADPDPLSNRTEGKDQGL